MKEDKLGKLEVAHSHASKGSNITNNNNNNKCNNN